MARPPIVLLLVMPALVAGCVALHAPLVADGAYPAAWPRPAPLRDQCRSLTGTYLSTGIVADAHGREVSLSLFDVLNLKATARRVSLEVATQRLDEKGDAFSTLVVIAGDAQTNRFELKNCFCVRQALACTQLSESSWAVPYVGLGGKQSNVYIGSASDGTLIMKLQNYRVDVVFGLPVFQKVEPWARFETVRP